MHKLLPAAVGVAHRKQCEAWLSRGCAGSSPHQQPSKQVVLPVSVNGGSPLSSVSMATLFVSPFPSLAIVPAVCLACMQSCSTSADRSFLSLFDISCFVLAVCTF